MSLQLNYKNIVYMTDKSYLFQTYVSMLSLKQNKRCNVSYSVYLLCIEFDDLGKIESLNSEDFQIKPIYIKKNIFKRPDNAGIVYYKLLLHELLDCDIVFHIDSDTVVVDDVSDVFDIDVSDYYCGAVRDKIKGFRYFNAGNVLFNLKKIREDVVNDTDTMYVYYDRLNKQLQDEKCFLWEQDILNEAFKGKIKYIHYGYNFLVNTYSKYGFNELVRLYGEPVKSKKLKILHYASFPKPWKRPNLFGQIWKMYAEETANKEKEKMILKVACREFK